MGIHAKSNGRSLVEVGLGRSSRNTMQNILTWETHSHTLRLGKLHYKGWGK
jgi:hypothetical protein